jgi:NAD-dependent DNA ligase
MDVLHKLLEEFNIIFSRKAMDIEGLGGETVAHCSIMI